MSKTEYGHAKLGEPFEQALAKLGELDRQMRDLRTINFILTQAIACAYCPECGKTIGAGEWIITDNQTLIHAGCQEVEQP